METQSKESATEKLNEPKKGKRINPNKLILTTYHNISNELKSRGVSEYTFDEFINDMFSKVNDSFTDDIITGRTPWEFKLKQALADESKKAAILKIIEPKGNRKVSKHDLDSKAQGGEDGNE
jgi:C-terminal processing protease CtpA/Prc